MKKIDLIRYITGELDSEGQLKVTEWINSSESNKRFFYCVKESYALLTLPEERAPEKSFTDFLDKYSLDDSTSSSQKNRSKNIFKIAIALSAAAVIALLITIGISNEEPKHRGYSNIIANNTAELMITNLPDGSTIGLSPAAEIRYNSNFNTTNRQVLLHGTCYFDVAKNKNLPFKIHPREQFINSDKSSQKEHKCVMIEVTGTRFYTTTQPDNTNLLEIALEQGSVAVKTYNGITINDILLKEGDYLSVTNSLNPIESTILEHGNPMDKAMCNFLKFKETKLSEIIKKLSAVHQCTFKITNPKIADHLLTADLAHNTLEDILLIFEVTMGVQSSLNSEGVIELN